MFIVLERRGDRFAAAIDDAAPVVVTDLPEFVAEHEQKNPRWVWDDTRAWYPELLAAHVRVQRCFDLRLCHAILRNSTVTQYSALAGAPSNAWDTAPEFDERAAPVRSNMGTLFDIDGQAEQTAPRDSAAEFRLQQEAVAASAEPGRIGRLLAAESAGALIAIEMQFAGLPWRADEHDRILSGLLGERPLAGERPEKLRVLLERIRELLEAPDLNADSPTHLMAALQNAGIQVASTRSWELRDVKHPVIEPLLEYKKLARLLSANGWYWVDTWVANGRFRPDYVPGGVVTGRWATSGGGALQLPRQIRGAVIADEGWKLVVADAAQLEPRILAALASDTAMISAGAEGDLYSGIVRSGAVKTRDEAKVGMLGAMYGATTGQSGRLLPGLARAYPQAIGFVEEAARAGERGHVVTTRLGRSSPPGDGQAYDEAASAAELARVRGRARAWGRFTRNFVVQGSAAEWALCWMASVRRRLTTASAGQWLTDGPHLVFFLHDEIVVHCPQARAEWVADEVRAAAAEAGTLLFGTMPAQFPVTVAIVDNYGQAK